MIISNLQLLCLILLIELLLNLWLFKGDLLAPSIIFNFMFLVAGLDLFFMVDYWKISLDSLTVVVVSTGAFSFIIGAWIIQKNRLRFVINKPERLVDTYISVIVPNGILDFFAIYTVFVIILYNTCRLQMIGGKFSFTNIVLSCISTELIEEKEMPFVISICRVFASSLAYIESYLFAINIIGLKQKNVRYIILIALSCLYFFLCTKRGNLIMYAVSTLYMLVLVTKNSENIKITRKIYLMILIAGFLLIIFFPAMGTMFGRTTVVTNPFEYISIYLGAPILNLDYFLKNNHVKCSIPLEYTFRSLYDFIYRYTGNKIFNIEEPNIFIYANSHTTGNVYTTFRDFYHDGNLLGVILFTLFMAFITQHMYKNIKKNNVTNKIFYYVIYSYIYGLIFRSFFANSFYEAIQPSILEMIVIWMIFDCLLPKLGLKNNAKQNENK